MINNNTKILLPFFSLLIVVIITIPIVYGYLISTPQERFTGIVGLYPQDQFYYLSQGPSQAMRGKILFSDKYGRIPDADIIVMPTANVIGLLTIIFHLSLPLAYYIFRILSAVFLVFAFMMLAAEFLSGHYAILLATGIYILGGGLGYYSHKFHIAMSGPVDGSIPEANMFISILGEFYLPVANALFIMALLYFYRIFYKGEKQIWICGMYLFLLGWVYIYGLVPAVIIIFVWSMMGCVSIKQIKNALNRLVILSLFCIPPAAYYAWLIYRLPALSEGGWYDYFSFAGLIATYGFCIFFTIAGFFIKRHKVLHHELYLILWIVCTLILIVAIRSVVPIQIQLLIGLGAPLAIVCTSTLNRLLYIVRIYVSGWDRHAFIYFKWVGTILIVLCFSMTNITFYNDQLSHIKKQDSPYFIDGEHAEAIAWSERNIPDSKKVVISRKMGCIFSSMTGCNVYCGIASDAETTREQMKTNEFFQILKSDDIVIARTVARQIDADYLFLDEAIAGKDLLTINLKLQSLYKRCFTNSKVSIFKLK